jgi:biopolymer transport protein ExbD
MRFGRTRTPQNASFDLTPMIDVVLLLIIFFTLTAQFARTQQRPMDLPREKGEKDVEAKPTMLVIDMDKAGRLSVLGTSTELPALTRMVEGEVLRAGEGLDLVVRADRQCPAAHLNRLAEALASVNIRNWKLATSSEGTGG